MLKSKNMIDIVIAVMAVVVDTKWKLKGRLKIVIVITN